MTSPNRCLIVGHSADGSLGGAELSLVQMAFGLNHLGLSVTVCLPHLENDSYNEIILGTGSALMEMPTGQRLIGGFTDPEVVEMYRMLILKSQFGLVITNTLVPFAPLIASSSLGVPSVVSVREDLYDPEILNFTNMNTLSLRTSIVAESDYVVCNSEYLLRQFAKFKNVFHLRNTPAELESLLKIDSLRDTEKTIKVSAVGSISPKKGFYDLLKVACALKDYNIQFQLFGTQRFDFDDLIKENLPQNISFFGYVTDKEQIYESTDVLISLSRTESFGRTIIEAMAAARPVISWDQGGRKETIIHGVTGFKHKMGDFESFAGSIKILASNGKKRLELGEAGRRSVREDWSKEMYLTSLSLIIDQVKSRN